MSKIFHTEVDAQGVATLRFDLPGRSTNVLNTETLNAFYAALDHAINNPAVKAILLTSGKQDFVAGADLDMMLSFTDAEAIRASILTLHQHLRRMETCGKPVAAAINGSALGGGFELCLACHYRVAGDNPKTQIGLPEVTLGLIPGAGGTQRLPRLLGIRAALPLLLEGKKMNPAGALKAGLIHAVVAAGEEANAARQWLLEHLNEPALQPALQPWDAKGYKIPGGGVASPAGQEAFYAANAMTLAKTAGNYPAAHCILSAVYNGLQTDFATAMHIEVAWLVKAALSPQAKAMIRTGFMHMQRVNRLAARPQNIAPRRFKKVGILGAGMMGAGIAYAQALAGIETVLLDTTQEAAERGKGYSRRLLEKQVEKNRLTAAAMEQTLALITPATDYAKLTGCDLVIEAVFEERQLKANVTRRAAAVLDEHALIASNTSTLPITSLASACPDPGRFIGLHFFSPVDKMKLVEIITGKNTSETTLAQAMDYVRQIKKTPIVVGDARGFYTSRVFSTYLREGFILLAEGVAPALIDHAGTLAGMPVGPLALADEVALYLIGRIYRQTAKDLGADYQRTAADDVVETAERLGWTGKKGGKGFYEYTAEGKRLSPELSAHFPLATKQPEVDAVRQRLMHIQSVEAVRCLEEGVVRDACDLDVGAVLGWGYPLCYGGPAGYIQQIGVGAFVAQCTALTQQHGPRFTPPPKLAKMAAAGEAFYGA